MKSIRLLGATLLASTTLLGTASAFAEVSQPETPTPASVQTPITANLTVNETPEKPVAPTDPDQGGTDQETDIEGLFGIAYVPKALSGEAQLEEKGQTEVALSNNTSDNNQKKYNVGVQDKTRGKDRNWTLSAQLEWTDDTQGYMEGATITASEGNVTLNDGKGNLTPITESEVVIGDSATNVTISKDAPVELMKAQKGKTVNGVYNYQFKDPKLVIPTSEKVAAGTYSGSINWTLSDVMY